MTNPILDRLMGAHLAYKAGKTREYEIARLQADARVQDLLDERNALAAAAAEEGISIRQIALLGLGIKNQQIAKDAVLAGRELRGERQAEPTEQTEQDEQTRYVYDAEMRALTVHMEPQDFEPYREALGGETPGEALAFTFHYDGKAILPVEDDWEHPVVTVMMLPASQKEAIAFIGKLPEH